MKKYINKVTITCIIFLLIAGYYTYTNITAEIPRKSPTVTIKYNDKNVPSNMADHTWFARKEGGSSCMTVGSYKIGQKTESIIVNSKDIMEIKFSSAPKEIRVLHWISNDKANKVHNVQSPEKKYELTLPSEKGEYIFEVMGIWDDAHNTSNVFRFKIE